MNKLILAISLFFALTGTIHGQTLKAWERAGDKALIKEDFYSAYRYFEIAIEYDSSKIDNWYKFAEAARQFDAYNKATEAYQRVLDSDRSGSYPLASFWQAVTRQKLGQYDAAKALYESFIAADNANIETKYKVAAQKGMEDCDWAIEKIVEANDTLQIFNMGDHINTPYSEFGPFLLADTLLYSSFQFVYMKDTVNPPRTHIKILQSIDNNKGKLLRGGFNLEDKHVAHTAFNTDYSTIYYTICDYIGETKDIKCALYSRYRLADGSWAEPQKLSINLDEFTNTQPNVGFDTETGQEFLYFASDRTGGKGGLDLWRSEIDSLGKLSDPENLSDINTDGNEATPFFHTLTQTLYFSSDGYQTLGGFDIYKAEKNGQSWELPDNLGIPINSSYNDLYYSLFSYGSKVYLSSNRPDSLAIFWDEDREACCNDLYSYRQPPNLDFLATTFNLIDSTALAGATLRIYDVTAGGKILIDSITNLVGNDFTYPLLPGKKYFLEAVRDGFSMAVDSVDLSPLLPELSPKIEKKLYLEPGLYLEALTFRKLDSVALTGSTVALYELINGEEKLIDSLTNVASNDFLFPLEPGKTYLIKGSRDGFFPITDTLDLSQPNTPLYGKIQRKLYLESPEPLFLEVLTFNGADSTAMAGAWVYLYKIVDGQEKLVDSLFNASANDFLFPLEPGKHYLVRGAKEGFDPVEQHIDLTQPGSPQSGKIQRKLYFDTSEPLLLEVLTFNGADSTAMAGAWVYLYEIVDGQEKLVDSLFNASANDFLFPLEPGKHYLVRGTKDGFDPVEQHIDLTQPGSPQSGKIQRKLYFDTSEPLLLEVLTFNGADSTAMAGAWVYLYEIVDGQEKLVDSLFNASANDFLFPLEPGKHYLVRGAKEGFDPVEQHIDLTQPGSPQSGKIQRKLYFDTSEPLLLEVLTFNGADSTAMAGAWVYLYEIVDGQEKLVDSLFNASANDFLFPLEPGKHYLVRGAKEGFDPVEQHIDLTQPGSPQSGKIQRKLYFDTGDPEILSEPLYLEVLTFRKMDSLALNQSTVSLFEMINGGYKLLDSITNLRGNDFLFPLEPLKQYVVQGMREGFIPVEEPVDLTQSGLPQSGNIQKKLYLDQAGPLQLTALTYRRLDSLALKGGVVTLYEIQDGVEIPLDSLSNVDNNDFLFPLERNKLYVIKGTHQGFYPTLDTIDTRLPEYTNVDKIEKGLFLMPPVRIEALTYREMDSLALPGSKLYIYDITGVEEKLVDSMANLTGNRFVLDKLDPRKQYVIKAHREGFYPTLDTLVLVPGQDMEKLLYLSPPQLKALTYNRQDLLALEGTTVFIYDITGGEERLLDSLVNNRDNNFLFGLEPNRDYLLKAYHADFHPLIDTLRLPPAKLHPTPFLERELKLIPKVVLDVQTFRQNDSLALFGSTVYLYDVTGETPILLDSLTADQEDNDFFFILQPNKKYIIGALKDGYHPISDTLDLTRPGIPNIGPLKRDLYLDRPELDASLEVLTFDEATREPLSGVRLKLLRITEDGVDTLDTQINEITNDFLFEISTQGGQYVILAQKKGYETTLDTISITPEELELLGGKKTYNVYLKQVSLDNMLPLALYFDNDRPDRRTWSTTTNTEYLPTNVAYYSRKDDFIAGFTEDMSESDKYVTVRLFETFFDREVKEAANELNKFTKQIHQHLKEGRSIKMRLKGFCSPRGATRYNQMLSSRRIDCVKNHFKRYEGGALMQYIRSGKLSFLEESYGESQADASKISDNFDDLKNSVFSLLASAERRVQIDEVIIE